MREPGIIAPKLSYKSPAAIKPALGYKHSADFTASTPTSKNVTNQSNFRDYLDFMRFESNVLGFDSS
jgi:hypothetical protein